MERCESGVSMTVMLRSAIPGGGGASAEISAGMTCYESKGLLETYSYFFFQAEDGIRDLTVTGVQTCALPICSIRRVLVDGHAKISNGRICDRRLRKGQANSGVLFSRYTGGTLCCFPLAPL